MNDKLSWVLHYHHNLFHADMVERAINDDSVTLDDFIKGYEQICISERDTDDDEFTPNEFKNV